MMRVLTELRALATPANAVALGAVAVFLTRRFGTRVAMYFGLLPFVTYLEIHTGTHRWPFVASAMLVVLSFQAIGSRPPERSRSSRAATGLTAVVLAYAAVATAQAFNPGLPSVTLGLRGARIFLEPILLYFVGAELAQRPDDRRRVIATILAAGAVVVAYAIKQAVTGFDAKELAYYRANFSIAAKESRTFSTMAGASVLGNYLALLAFLALGHVVHGARRPRLWALLILGCAYASLLTGQRGVYVAALAGAVVAVGLTLLRPETATRGRVVALGFGAVMAVVIALLVTTPVQDRREVRRRSANAFEAARIKLALLKSGGKETSVQLRVERLRQLGEALETAPEGAGSGLNLLFQTPGRQASASLLGRAGFGQPDYKPKLEPRPGENYYLTVGSELGLAGLALFGGILLFAIGTAAGVAYRHPDPGAAAVAIGAAGFFVFVAVNSASVDALTASQVASYFWLLVGLAGRWGQEIHEPAVLAVPLRGTA